MKKIFWIIICFLLQIHSVNAATQVKVSALENFCTEKPKENFNVKIEENVTLGNYDIKKDTNLNCIILKVVEPKRGKRNATFYVKPFSYTYNNQSYPIKEEMYGKYSKRILSKEELKKLEEKVAAAEKNLDNLTSSHNLF